VLTPELDLSAAAHADVLFAKTKPDGESDLAQYCDERGIGYVPFRDFDEALPIVQAVVRGELSAEEALGRDWT
jgi:2-hydroxy-3-keto-5-methylthiopentenyl-1-phosphate phosphatase